MQCEEILFANWGPSCRILVESISEWFLGVKTWKHNAIIAKFVSNEHLHIIGHLYKLHVPVGVALIHFRFWKKAVLQVLSIFATQAKRISGNQECSACRGFLLLFKLHRFTLFFLLYRCVLGFAATWTR